MAEQMQANELTTDAAVTSKGNRIVKYLFSSHLSNA